MFTLNKPLQRNPRTEAEEKERERIQKIHKILHEMVEEFGVSDTWSEIKHIPDVKKEFLKLYEKPKSFFYKRNPK